VGIEAPSWRPYIRWHHIILTPGGEIAAGMCCRLQIEDRQVAHARLIEWKRCRHAPVAEGRNIMLAQSVTNFSDGADMMVPILVSMLRRSSTLCVRRWPRPS
jgi:hypothetical protein